MCDSVLTKMLEATHEGRCFAVIICEKVMNFSELFARRSQVARPNTSFQSTDPHSASIATSGRDLRTEVPLSRRNRGVSRNHLLLLACILVLGFWLRFHNVGVPSLSMDEAATAAIVNTKWSSFWKLIFSREMNMAAYYGILRAFRFLQHSEALLRLASVIFGGGLIAAVWMLSREVFEETQQMFSHCSAVLVAVNGFLIAYSQEARGYSMAVCLLALSTCAAAVVIKKGTLRATWCMLALSAIYSHLYAVLWIAPQLWAIWRTHRSRGWKFFREIAIVGAVGLIPLCVFALRTRGGQLDWVSKLTPRSLIEVFVQIAGYSPIALLLLCAGSVIGCVALWRRGDVLSRLIVWENVLPVTVLLACSPIHPLIVPRFLIFAVPFLIITAVIGFAKFHGWGFLALVPITVTMLMVGNRSVPKGDWKSITQSLCSQPHQAVAFWPPMQRLPYWYYSQSHAACTTPVSAESREPALSDFGGNKHVFESKLCLSGERSIVTVTEPDWQGHFPDPLTTKCYVPTSVKVENGLQVTRLQRATAD